MPFKPLRTALAPSAAWLKATLRYRFPCAILLLLLILHLLRPESESLLQFDRTSIEHGDWYRLLTGHFIHYDHYHFAMNAIAYLLITLIFLPTLTMRSQWVLLVIMSLGISLGLYWLNPELDYYAGFSGVLHGWLALLLVLDFKQHKLINSCALLILSTKIIYEQTPFYNAEHPLLSVPVATNAHLLGYLFGIAIGILMLTLPMIRRSAPQN